MTAPATNHNKPREYLIGVVPRLEVTFRDKNGVAVTPTTVRFKFKKPDGSVTLWVYGTHPEVSLDAPTNTYSAELPTDQAGTWFYRWESSGTYQAAAERSFNVLPSQII